MKTKLLLAVVLLLSSVIAKSQTLSVSVSPDTSVCAGKSVQVVCSPSGGTSPYTYSWSPSNGVFGGTPVVTPTITTVYKVTVMDVLGASATDSVVIAVYENPVVDAGQDTSICIGSSLMLGGTPTASGSAKPFTYQWTPANGLAISTVPNPITSVTSTTTYLVVVQDTNGCSATDSVVVTVGSNPVIDSIYSKGINCFDTLSGRACVFLDGSVGGNGGNYNYSYSWASPVTTPNPPNPCSGASLYIDSLAMGNYTITVTNNTGCTASSTFTVGRDTMILSFTSVSDGVYPDTLQVNVNGGTPPYMYVWQTSHITQAIEVLQAGYYGLTVVDGYNCTETGGTPYPIPQSLSVSTLSDTTICKEGYFILSSSVAGGTPPYTYKWTPGLYLSDSTILNPSLRPSDTITYTLLVTDALGDTSSAVVTINTNENLNPVVDSFTFSEIQCFGGTAQVCAYVSGGVQPYNYLWSTFQGSYNCINGLFANKYFVFVTDKIGCNVLDSITIIEPPQLKIDSLFVYDETCPNAINGTILSFVSGGTPSYTYSWFNNTLNLPVPPPSSIIINLPSGRYSLTVTDSNGCTAIDSTIVNVLPQHTAQLISATGGILPDTLTINTSGGIQPYSFNWITGDTGSTLILDSTFGVGMIAAVVTDTKGCSVLSDTIYYGCPNTCVWPGDANYDGIVNNNDLLTIGLVYGATGNARVQQDIQWYAHQATNWNDSLNDTLNYKHIDCDGNGTINANDTLAIIQNYNLTHPRSGGPATPRANAPELAITLSADTLADGQTVIASLQLGNAQQPANNVYGIAFTFNFDQNVVDSAHVAFNVNSSSWLCSPNDHISIHKKFVPTGKIDVAITRIDKTARSGSGEIATAILKITTGNINGKDLDYYTFNTYISNVRAVDNQGEIMDVNEGSATAVVEFTPSAIRDVQFENNAMLLYPNPVADKVMFALKHGGIIQSWQMTSADGKLVMAAQNSNASEVQADVSALAKGIYFIHVTTANSHGAIRFVKE